MSLTTNWSHTAGSDIGADRSYLVQAGYENIGEMVIDAAMDVDGVWTPGGILLEATGATNLLDSPTDLATQDVTVTAAALL